MTGSYLLEAGVSITVQHGAFSLKAGVDALHGDSSTGVNGQLSVAYQPGI